MVLKIYFSKFYKFPVTLIIEFSFSKATFGIYLFKINIDDKDTHCDVNDVILVSLFITLNRFHTFIWCFHYRFEQLHSVCVPGTFVITKNSLLREFSRRFPKFSRHLSQSTFLKLRFPPNFADL